ncbi:hypothetical protein L861_03600 [Litchfieldella anticariensis FP35 = DSM 16096]|uniref:Putative membrane protein insertion efficiency factor n=1 Tax=Litchfieldella anticariensis (strain DSM 16096 / CECT 5854 / CIP 108499 / LMG 22089 / FP35) TaxID=1121939 RepID=S2KRB7_LITA3|nr:membrane protein insertion efficiency factor YidD [Halomonas anticariensis]EPC04420.1 hypothetical protein L861_03600 [Halomonas anticariensis FP35 = DSM 16096]
MCRDSQGLGDTAAKLLSWPLIILIKVYQYTVSPLLGPRCRFWPSCSHYALEAIHTHGPLKGGWLALKRILKCHPWHPGGIDLVPPASGKGGSCNHHSDGGTEHHQER